MSVSRNSELIFAHIFLSIEWLLKIYMSYMGPPYDFSSQRFFNEIFALCGLQLFKQTNYIS